MKYLIVLGFIGIIGALVMAGVYMLRDGPEGRPKASRMARALALRVALSIALFTCILASYWLGWIQPTGVPLSR